MVQMVNFMLHVFHSFTQSKLVTIRLEIYYSIKINPKDKKIILKVTVQFLKENFVILLAVENFFLFLSGFSIFNNPFLSWRVLYPVQTLHIQKMAEVL